jgi:hypothetical protein
MGVMTTGNFPKTLWPGVNKFWGQFYNEWTEEWTECFEEYTSDQNYEEDVGVTGYGLAAVKDQGRSITYDEMNQGFIDRYTHVVYAIGFIITREEIEDNLYPQLSLKRSKSLAFSMRQTKEEVAANIFNRAFDSNYTYGDGLELCSDVHLNVTGGTWRNELSSAADLSEAALEQSCIDIAKFTTDRGLAAKVLPKKLLVPPDLMFEATRILESTLQNDSANNAVNALRVMGSIPQGFVVNHYLSDVDAYFILTDCPDGLKCFKRRAAEFDQDNDFDTENFKAKATERYSFGATDKRSVFGSPGV